MKKANLAFESALLEAVSGEKKEEEKPVIKARGPPKPAPAPAPAPPAPRKIKPSVTFADAKSPVVLEEKAKAEKAKEELTEKEKEKEAKTIAKLRRRICRYLDLIKEYPDRFERESYNKDIPKESCSLKDLKIREAELREVLARMDMTPMYLAGLEHGARFAETQALMNPQWGFDLTGYADTITKDEVTQISLKQLCIETDEMLQTGPIARMLGCLAVTAGKVSQQNKAKARGSQPLNPVIAQQLDQL